MTIWERMRRWSLRAGMIWSVRQPGVPYMVHLPYGGVGAARKTEDYLQAYGTIGWLFAVVSRIAAGVSDAEWRLERPGAGSSEITDHPLLTLLADANPFWTGQELIEYTQMWVDLAGEAFWVVNRGGRGWPEEIWPVPPNRMRVVASKGAYLTGYVYEFEGERVPLAVDRVIHFRLPNPYNMYRGLGPVQAMAVDLDSESYAAQWNKNFFLNSARPDGVLQIEGTVTDEEYQRLRSEWSQHHQGVGQAHRVAILEGGMSYKQIQLSQQEMSFIEQRKLNRDAILGVYGMPLSVLGISETVNRANAESGEYVFARWVLRPRLQRIKHKLNETLVPMFGSGLRLGYADPTPENREESRLAAESGLRTGYMTVNEARGRMDLDPLADGNIFLWWLAVMPTPVASLGSGRVSGQPPGGDGPSADGEEGEGKEAPTPGPSPKGRGEEAPGVVRGLGEAAKERLGGLWLRRLPGREGRFKRVMLGYWERQAVAMLEALGEEAPPAPQRGEKVGEKVLEGFDWALWLRELVAVLGPVVRATVEEGAEGAIEDYGLGIAFDVDNPRVQLWMGQHLDKSTLIVEETTREDIRGILAEAEAEGASIDEMTRRIKGYYDNIDYRAERVARTETVSASNHGAFESYHQAGVREKEWWAALDERTRERHLAAHGEVVPIEAPFVATGEEMMYPGDDAGSAGNVINCQCTVLPVVE